MSRLKLVLLSTIVGFCFLLPCKTPGYGAPDQRLPSNLQSSYGLTAAVTGSGGCIGASTEYRMAGTLSQSSPVGEGMAAGRALYAGFWGEVWMPAPVSVDIDVECPRDTITMPSCTDVGHLLLSGFRITNRSSMNLCIGYDLTSTGPAALVDNGNPASLHGTTAPLAPGKLIWLPQAALEIPPMQKNLEPYISYDFRQNVDYQCSPIGSPDGRDSCATSILYTKPPTGIFLTRFEARALENCVELVWEVESDLGIAGFRLYRRGESDAEVPVNPGELIPRAVRKYLDRDISGGRTYWYTLGVEWADKSEDLFGTVMVRTKVPSLALHQNIPNPFNPRTTISFALPASTHVVLSVLSLEGRLIKTLVDTVLDEGSYDVSWDGKNEEGNPVSAGVYVYKLEAGEKVLTRKVVFLK